MGGGNSRNFITAVVLSLAVLLVWQLFFAPQSDTTPQTTEPAEIAADGGDVPQPAVDADIPQPEIAASPAADVSAQFDSREEALAASARVPIETPSLTGSINLVGGRIDDLSLNDYELCPRSELYPCSVERGPDGETPDIVLLSPDNAPNGYFAEFGWVSGNSDMPAPGPRTVWTAEAGAVLTPQTPVVLTYDDGAGLVFTRTVSVDEDYMFTVTDAVANDSGEAVALTPYGRITRLGEPSITGFFILHEGMIGSLHDQGMKKASYGKVEDAPPIPGTPGATAIVYEPASSGWIGITDKYWATTLIPEAGQEFVGRYARFTNGGLRYQADYLSTTTSVGAGETYSITNNLFAGAKEVAIVDGYDRSMDLDRFELLIDWGWFYFITKPMFTVLDWLYGLVGNFGVAILLITVLIKLIFFPLANRSYRSMAAQRKVMPKIQALRERYKDDRAKQQQAMLEIYRKEKINPLSGCWPILIQIPVFFSLYSVIFITIEMRHAPFFGWIQDLSAPDPTSFVNLFGLLPFDSPGFLAIGVWPILMGLTMWIQMKLNPQQPGTPQIIFNILPIVFTFLLASFPAGLVIYWAWNNFLSVLQQSFIMRRHGVKVDIIGNIRDTFRRKPKADADAKS